jgi:hypothetical protein
MSDVPNLLIEEYKSIVEQIELFKKDIKSNQELVVRATHGGLVISGIGYSQPSTLLFEGHDEQGNLSNMIQHYTQASLILSAVFRNPQKPPRQPFGFLGDLGKDAQGTGSD